MTGTEFAPDFFAAAGWDHRASEISIAAPVLPRPGEPDSPDAQRLGSVHRVDVDVWHTAMLGADPERLREQHADADGFFRSAHPDGTLVHDALGFEAALPFLLDDFGSRERAALLRLLSPEHLAGRAGLRSTSITSPAYAPDNRWTAGPAAPYDYPCCWNGPTWNYASSWILLALGRLAGRRPEFEPRFGALFRQWSDSHFTVVDSGFPLAVEHHHPETGRAFRVVTDYFHSAWLSPFMESVLRGAAPDLELRGVPWDGDERTVTVDAGRTTVK